MADLTDDERYAYQEAAEAASIESQRKARAEAEAAGGDLVALEAEGLDLDGNAIGDTSWGRVDMGPALRGERVIEPPRFLERDDGVKLIYPGRPHSFFGPSESLKTWAAILACADVIAQGLSVLYIDFESDEVSFVSRTRLIGIPDEALGPRGGLAFVRPSEALRSPAARKRLAMVGMSVKPALIVLDGVTECYALHGWDPNSATDVANYQAAFLRGLVIDGSATLEIDHTAKIAGAGQFGSQHKRAGIDGASYEFKNSRPGGEGQVSTADIHVSKDRHGMVQKNADPEDRQIATIILDGSGWAKPAVYLKSPDRQAKITDAAMKQQERFDAVQRYLALRDPDDPKDRGSNAVGDGAGLGARYRDSVILHLEAQGLIEDRGTEFRHRYYLTPKSSFYPDSGLVSPD